MQQAKTDSAGSGSPAGRGGRTRRTRRSRLRSLLRALAVHVETWRPDRLGYVGLVGVAGALVASPHHVSGWTLAGAWAAPTLGWVAALYGGDYLDRRLDAVAKPARPLPSGRMSPAAALAGAAIAAAAGIAIAALLSPLDLAIVAAVACLAASYSAFLKRRGLLGNVARGATTALALVFGALAAAERVPPATLLLVGAVWAHDTASNLVGALRDADGDREGGYRTVPVRHGPVATRRAVVALYALAVALAGAFPLAASLGAHALPYALLVGAAAAGGAVALYALAAPTPEAAGRAHRVIVVERLVLACAFVAAGGSAAGALGALAATAAAAVALQLHGRRRAAPAATPAPAVDLEAIRRYVDSQLRALAAASGGRAAVAGGWRRRIRIDLREPDGSVFLVADEDGIERVDEAAYGRSALPPVRIATTGATFYEIFLAARTSPRRAYLTGRVTIEAPPRDMLRLNALFNEFRRLVPASGGRLEVVERARDAGEEERRAATVVIADTTLRDGEQMPGVAFGLEDKVELARRLDAAGVPLLEVGYPVVSRSEAAAVRAIVSLGLGAVVQVVARPLRADVEAALETGAESVAVFVGTSDSHVEGKLRTTRDALLAQVADAVALVKAEGRQAVFAAEDATRSPRDLLLEALRAAAAAGADAVGLADTVGVGTPEGIAELVRAAAGAVDVPIAVHCHDDLGLATANSIAGLLAGASAVQCSVLGIGERAGNAALEEVALALEVAHGVPTGLDLTRLRDLAAFVARLVGQPIPASKAVVGANAFVHESGLHVDGVARDPRTYEPYPPELVGASRRFVLGKHSGRRAIAEALGRNRVTAERELVDRLLPHVKAAGEAHVGLDDAQLVTLARELARAGGES